jgi:HAUS augmin-like complex subunit 6 N-terminus
VTVGGKKKKKKKKKKLKVANSIDYYNYFFIFTFFIILLSTRIISTMSLQVEQLWFQNMLLLGFDVEQESKNHRLDIAPSMFRRANVKGFEVVFHFLFSKASQKKANEVFRHLWPVLDKTQSREFKTWLCTWLTELDQAHHLPPGCFRRSTLTSASGERFYQLLWHTSTYVLQTVFERDLAKYAPIGSMWLLDRERVEEAVQLAKRDELVMTAIENFSVQQQLALDAHIAQTCVQEENWRSYATDLTETYRSQHQELLDVEKELTEAEHLLHSAMHDWQNRSLDEEIQDVRSVKHSLETQNSRVTHAQSMMLGVTQSNGGRAMLDACDADTVRCFNHALEQIQLQGLSEVANTADACTELQQSHSQYLSNLESLSAELHNDVEQLREQTQKNDVRVEVKSTMSFVPPTPACWNMNYTRTTSAERERTADEKHRMTPVVPQSAVRKRIAQSVRKVLAHPNRPQSLQWAHWAVNGAEVEHEAVVPNSGAATVKKKIVF